MGDRLGIQVAVDFWPLAAELEENQKCVHRVLIRVYQPVCLFFIYFFILRSLPIGEPIGKELRETLRE